jgi:hypothetical protein
MVFCLFLSTPYRAEIGGVVGRRVVFLVLSLSVLAWLRMQFIGSSKLD